MCIRDRLQLCRQFLSYLISLVCQIDTYLLHLTLQRLLAGVLVLLLLLELLLKRINLAFELFLVLIVFVGVNHQLLFQGQNVLMHLNTACVR